MISAKRWTVFLSLCASSLVPKLVIAADAGDLQLATIEIVGVERTRPETITELLPRGLPNAYTEAELLEFRRRVANLQLFDSVTVGPDGPVLRVVVREKLSVTPILDFSTGKTWRDASATIGAIENNVGGHGTRLGGFVKYNERGPQVGLWLSEHSYHPGRWQKEVDAFYAGSGFRFEGSGASWHRTRIGGEVEFKSPYSYRSPLRYEVVTSFYRERLTYAAPDAPPDGYYAGLASEFIWDQYSWNDLVPSGLKVELELRPGIFLGPAQPRHKARFTVIGGLKLGASTVLAFRAVLEGVNSGNVNHSALLGSQEGVRGLPDSLFRNQAHTFANVELRHAFDLGKRWYLQPVAFVDAARFLTMSHDGRPTSWRSALAFGGGVRVVPTALVKTLLRVDVSRLVTPTEEWFLQLGIDQYF